MLFRLPARARVGLRGIRLGDSWLKLGNLFISSTTCGCSGVLCDCLLVKITGSSISAVDRKPPPPPPPPPPPRSMDAATSVSIAVILSRSACRSRSRRPPSPSFSTLGRSSIAVAYSFCDEPMWSVLANRCIREPILLLKRGYTVLSGEPA